MSSPQADRNLLFGIFALQMDFISRDALIKGVNAWVLEKTRPLGEILYQQGALRGDMRQFVETMIEKHLQAHANDPQRSLAAIITIDYVRQDLNQIADADLEKSLGHVPVSNGGARDVHATVSYSVGTSTSAGTRFRILRPHAKGGLGQVYVAHDEELQREVALKEIQERYAGHPESRARFLLEAQISGGLEHPGIVPVYGLGTHPDGRPFYAMRFIRGDSLKDAIERFHRVERGAQSAERERPRALSASRSALRASGERTIQFHKLLRRFLDICNAIQYAHDRGVLHRDLKPGNIMLGKYGETLVVDWGLAKVRGQGTGDRGQIDEKMLRPASASGSAETVAGSVLGTPQYMSPEQAEGRLDLLGPASDVYSLGATLYCVLTGKAPFQDRDTGRVLEKVQKGDFPVPRAVEPDVPAPLEAVCLKAMARRPKDRYDSPRALADDIEHWLADEPVSAWPEPWTVKTGRWMRRHKPLVSGAAAAIFVGLIGLTVGLLWYQDEQNRRAQNLARAEEAIHIAVGQAEQLRRELHEILEKPGGVFGLLNRPEDWRARIKTAQAALRPARDRLNQIQDEVDSALNERATQLEHLLRQDEEDRLLAVRLEKIRMDKATWQGESGKDRTAFDRATAAREYPKAFSEAGYAVLGEQPVVIAARFRASPIKEQLVAALDSWADVAFLFGDHETPDQLLEIARRTAPDPAWGDRIRQPKVWSDRKEMGDLVRKAHLASLSPELLAVIAYRLGRNNPLHESWLRRAQAQYPADYWLNLYLGGAVEEANAVEAAGFIRVAIAVRPTSSAAYNNLGVALSIQKKLPEAIAAYEKAIELDEKNHVAYYMLGNALSDQKKLSEASAAYRKAIELAPKLSWAYLELGRTLIPQKKLPEAVMALQKAIELDPQDDAAYFNLGKALYAQKNLPGATAAYRKAIEFDPKDAAAYYNLGNALRDQDKRLEAIAAFSKAIELDPKDATGHLGSALREQKKLLEAYRTASERAPKSAAAYNNLGNALFHQKKLLESIAAYRKAIELDPKLAPAYNGLGNPLRGQKKLPEAIAAYRKAIELDPKFAMAYYNLGSALDDQGNPRAAIAAYKKAIGLNPDYAEAHCNLAHALRACGDFAAALEALKTGHLLGSRRSGWPYPSAQWVTTCQQLLALDQRIPGTLNGQAASAADLLAMADLCVRYKKRYRDAAVLFGKAFQENSALAANSAKQHRYNAGCAAAMAGTGQGDEGGKLSPDDKVKFRRQAHDWLQADLQTYSKLVKEGKAAGAAQAQMRLSQWQTDGNLAGVRESREFAKLPPEEAKLWQKLWSDVAALLKEVRSRFIDTRLEGELTEKDKSNTHPWKLTAGRTYVIEMTSTAFDTFLKLQDSDGTLLAENDDIVPDVNTNSRLIFTAPRDAVYRIVATSFEQAGQGPYVLTIREFTGRKC